MVRLSITYLLWLIGGIFGLHLIYLGRYRQAYLHMITFAWFGLGPFYDLIYIPQYVQSTNSDPGYLSQLMAKTKSRPQISITRLIATYICAYLFSQIAMSPLFLFEPIQSSIGTSTIYDMPIYWVIIHCIAHCIGIQCGILLAHTIGNTKRISHTYLFISIIIGTICDVILCYLSNVNLLVLLRIVFPLCFYSRSCEWDPTVTHAHTVSRYLPSNRHHNSSFKTVCISFCCILFLSICTIICIIISLSSYTSLYIDNTGQIEYSELNYGTSIVLPALHYTATTTPIVGEMTTGTTTVDAIGYATNIIFHNTTYTNTINTTQTSNSNNNNMIFFNHSLVFQPSNQRQYTYKRFTRELYDVWNHHTASLSATYKDNNNSIDPHTYFSHLSPQYHYKIYDVVRHIIYSPAIEYIKHIGSCRNLIYSSPSSSTTMTTTAATTAARTVATATAASSSEISLYNIILHLPYTLPQCISDIQSTLSSLSSNINNKSIFDLNGILFSTQYISKYFNIPLQSIHNYNNNYTSSSPSSYAITLDERSMIASSLLSYIHSCLDPVDGDIMQLSYTTQSTLYYLLTSYQRITANMT